MPSASSAITGDVEAPRRGSPQQEVEILLPLDGVRPGSRYRGLTSGREIYRPRTRAPLAADALKVRTIRRRARTPVSGWMPVARSRRRATAEVSGPPGAWKLAVATSGAKINEPPTTRVRLRGSGRKI